MQNSHCQINCRQLLSQHWGMVVSILLTPMVLWAVLYILPTHDDWASSTTPDFNPFFIKEHFFFYGYHWRPFDTWIGYIAGRNPQLLYPAFNHVLVVIGHLLATWCLYRVLAILSISKTAQNMATLFFFVTPACMATVTAVDSQNQVYALTYDMVAFMAYVKLKKHKYLVWPLLVFIATLCKENGLMWALICPILAFGFNIIDKKTLKKDMLIGIAIMMVYALAIMLLPKDITIHPEYEPGILKVIKNGVKCLFTSFITVDYVYLLHQPSRNLLLAGISLVMTIPFCYLVFIQKRDLLVNKKTGSMLLCLMIAVGPHLLTVFSMMHTYAGLPLVALIIAHLVDSYQKEKRKLMLAFMLFLTAAMAIDAHLIDCSIKSGRIGKEMAQEAIRKTGIPTDNAYVVIIEDDYPKLSSFCVIPSEAFGWGWASRYETNYQWPQSIKDTTIVHSENALEEAKQLSRKIVNEGHYGCVWIVNHQQVDVVKR